MAQDQLIRSFYEAASKHDVEKFVSFFHEDAQFHDKSSAHTFRGHGEIREMVQGWLKALPDMRLQVTNVIGNGNGDVFCAETSVVGTHKGPLESHDGSEIPATGKSVNVPSCDVIRLKDGKIQSLNCYFSGTQLMVQIGAMPASQAA